MDLLAIRPSSILFPFFFLLHLVCVFQIFKNRDLWQCWVKAVGHHCAAYLGSTGPANGKLRRSNHGPARLLLHRTHSPEPHLF